MNSRGKIVLVKQLGRNWQEDMQKLTSFKAFKQQS